jgi:SAM-dependent methyltransferase
VKFDAAYMQKRMEIAWRGPIIADAIMDVLNPKYIADLGCGTGDIVKGLLNHIWKVWGVDNSPAAGELCERVMFRSDIATCPCLPQVDVAILMEVLSVVPNPEEILAAAQKIAKTLIVNHTESVPGWWKDEDATHALREKLKPWGSKPAIKAWYRSAEIWRAPEAGDNRASKG